MHYVASPYPQWFRRGGCFSNGAFPNGFKRTHIPAESHPCHRPAALTAPSLPAPAMGAGSSVRRHAPHKVLPCDEQLARLVAQANEGFAP